MSNTSFVATIKVSVGTLDVWQVGTSHGCRTVYCCCGMPLPIMALTSPRVYSREGSQRFWSPENITKYIWRPWSTGQDAHILVFYAPFLKSCVPSLQAVHRTGVGRAETDVIPARALNICPLRVRNSYFLDLYQTLSTGPNANRSLLRTTWTS